ncbi:helix-turn-helix transcriptional regulator [Vibrio salinus]|uniref:helix-turn-helix transcriptional regulator n=1 Tax=Vibrio salinus TaxID=2899784 RepID=UPI001E5CA296|nr:helix-turn-helix transcriptional regulator [Vibrio salinus]MCE0494881.1 helix-turn-helix transcriptional regulator [Vibrio salinus]
MKANQLIQKYASHQLITKKIDMPAGYLDDSHSHPWHQIVFPLTGLLQSNMGHKRAIVPHNALLFIPANTVHKSVAVTDTQFFAIYLNPNALIHYGDTPKSCLVTAFLKELLLLLFDKRTAHQSEASIAHLLAVLNDQIETAEHYEIPLLIPEDRRLMAIFNQLRQQPDLKFTLKDWAEKVGASERTLSRLCAKEFNLSFSLWRQNIRLVLSLQLLDTGMAIQEIAVELGYASDSAYIHAFKGMFDQTPSRYRHSRLLYSLSADQKLTQSETNV